jgi:hypothetical protein
MTFGEACGVLALILLAYSALIATLIYKAKA